MKREFACLGHLSSLAVENSGTALDPKKGNVCGSKVSRKKCDVNKIYLSIYYTERFTSQELARGSASELIVNEY
jgi:hypothetical protein